VSFRKILGAEVYGAIWPDWKASKRKSVQRLSQRDSRTFAFVAEHRSTIIGFISFKLDVECRIGTLQYLAVHPDYQCKGIGTDLIGFALARMKESGMRMAIAETGGDTSHLPARKSYEKSGYTGLPLVRYFKTL
jgi:GNAT superfamily N-acetyltransferase